MKQALIPPATVRALVATLPGTVAEKAKALGMSRPHLYRLMEEGVQVDLSQAALNMLAACDVEITTKQRSKR